MYTATNTQRKSEAFTLIELLASVAIVAVLVTAAIFFTYNYVTYAKQVSDQRTLVILNDALTRYKCEGGNLTALTSGAPIANVIAALRSPITWNGIVHNVMQGGSLYISKSIDALGSAGSYRFTRFNSFTNEPGGTSTAGIGDNATHGLVSFTSVGSTTWTVPAGVTVAQVLVVAGGGGGGWSGGGGGGGGGVIYQSGYSVTPGASLNVTVGAGGAGGVFNTAPYIGLNGGNSVFDALTAIGGGGGGSDYVLANAPSGGSGGGAGRNGYAGGTATAGQGCNGGGTNTGSGGGGAGGIGQNGPGGVGGNGVSYSISGSAIYYAGGGGGINASNGLGGGSTANRGGGGTGTFNYGAGSPGSPGGSGIVIVSY
jgi:prepilin-type N-terminal cleavage/methylation domain-containing protein